MSENVWQGVLDRLRTALDPEEFRRWFEGTAYASDSGDQITVWVHSESVRRHILVHYLTTTAGGDNYRLDDVLELLKLVETYQPADVKELLAQIPHWQQVLRQEINESGSPKPFFNERVQELHGGGRDQRRQDNSRTTAKENERAFLERLEKVLSV